MNFVGKIIGVVEARVKQKEMDAPRQANKKSPAPLQGQGFSSVEMAGVEPASETFVQ